MSFYERLGAMDASFLGIEDENCHMHVGGVMLFDATPLHMPGGGINIERIRAGVHARLHLVPRFRQRLAHVPYEGSPVWIDDDKFRLAYHVRHTALPYPGDERILKRLVGRIMSQALDRKRPLWEMWVVEGLDDNRFALINKTHHCMIDGVSGADLMSVILSPFEEVGDEAPEPWVPRPHPTKAHLVADAIVRRAEQPAAAIRAIGDMISTPEETIRDFTDAASGVLETLAPALNPVSHTPLNVDVGPHRRFDWTSMQVADLKAVKNVLGGTLNDVVLATVSGALRSFFEKRGLNPDEMAIRSMVPVSVRSTAERGQLGNRVTQLTVPLPVHLDDPVARLHAIRNTTAGLKESRQALGGEVLTAISEWTVPNVLVQAVRLAARTRPFNLVVTNVPGPQIPLYFQGATMHTAYPLVPLFHRLCLVVGLFSYNGGLFWGFNADWEQVPDLHDFILAIESNFRVLQDAAAAADTPLATSRTAATSARRTTAKKRRKTTKTTQRASTSKRASRAPRSS